MSIIQRVKDPVANDSSYHLRTFLLPFPLAFCLTCCDENDCLKEVNGKCQQQIYRSSAGHVIMPGSPAYLLRSNPSPSIIRGGFGTTASAFHAESMGT